MNPDDWTEPSPDEDPELWELYRETNRGESFREWWLAGFEQDEDGPADEFGPTLYDLDDDADIWFLYAEGTEGEGKPMPLDEWYRDRYEPDQPEIPWLDEWADDELLDSMIRDATTSAWDDGDDEIDYAALDAEQVDEIAALLTEAFPGNDPDDCNFGPHYQGDEPCHACGFVSTEDGDSMLGDPDSTFDEEGWAADGADLEFSVADRTMLAAWMDDELRSEWVSEGSPGDFLEWAAEHDESDVWMDRAWDNSKGIFRGEPGELAEAPPDDPDEWWRLGFDHADMLSELAEWEALNADDDDLRDHGLEDATTEVDDLDVEDFEDDEVRAELWSAELAERAGNEWGWDGWDDVTGDAGWGGDTWGGDGWGDGMYGDGWGGDAFDFGNSFEWGDF